MHNCKRELCETYPRCKTRFYAGTEEAEFVKRERFCRHCVGSRPQSNSA